MKESLGDDADDDALETLAFLADPRTFNSARVRQACIPSANGHFNAIALAQFYSSMIEGNEHLPSLLSRDTVKKATKLYATDKSGEVHTKFGIGWQLYDFESGSRGVGHTGFGGSIALFLPDSGYSIAITTNQLHVKRNPSVRQILDMITTAIGAGKLHK